MPVDLVRDAALDVILRVFDRGVHLDESLDKTLRRKAPSDRGRRFMTQLVYGTVRHRRLCDHVLQKICTQPLDKLPTAILAVLRMGVFQSVFCNQVNKPSMVNTSVDLARRRGHAGTARLTNAILRRVPESIDAIEFPEDPAAYIGVRYSLPDWLVKDWLDEFGRETTEELAAASALEAATTFRANTLKESAEVLQARLKKAGIETTKATTIPEELTVIGGGAFYRTKAFLEGRFTLQDPASMLASHLVEPKAGERILDMCAAPGGKTTHLAQLSADEGMIVAADHQRRRLYRLEENVARLEVRSARAVVMDGGVPCFGPVFDRVLVDAPCSGLGTLRRHPDLKWHTNPAAVKRLAAQQRALLRSAAALCRPGGTVVYSVCTIGAAETTAVVADAHAEMKLEFEDGPEWLDTWRIGKGQYRTLPSSGGLDGFFLTRFRKPS